MSKSVVINLGHGELYLGFPRITVQLWVLGHPLPEQFIGWLPPAPNLIELYKKWRSNYDSLCDRMYLRSLEDDDLEIDFSGITNISITDFHDLCQKLAESMNAWLRSEGIVNISRQVRSRLNPKEEIRVILETNDLMLRRLPWHRCDFFEDYPLAEMALSRPEYKRREISPLQIKHHKVRILAILGNSAGIDLEAERKWLNSLPDSEIVFLVKPKRQEFNTQLWDSNGWDILFFAGHSQTEGETGKIYINENPTNNSLGIEQLEEALKVAIDKGLKLAIFNSCDGLGLALSLEKLNIPTIIVMRESVPNLVAQEFFNNFLQGFAIEQLSLFLAVQQARRKLQGLEDDFPCASWLPVICQNPAATPPTWLQLSGKNFRRRSLFALPQEEKMDWGNGTALNFDCEVRAQTRYSAAKTTRKRQDWGDAIDVSAFYGRTEELAQLEQWVVHDQSRLITLFGMGGIGKTALSVKLAQLLEDEFEYLIWRSLRNAPTLPELLTDLINFFSHQQERVFPETVDAKIARLIEYLRSARCLLVLDNVESILSSDKRAGAYRQGYEGYGQLFRCVGETNHQSCLVLTSREKLRGISVKEGKNSRIHSLRLSGLPQEQCHSILLEKGFSVSEDEGRTLVSYYAGNPLALKIVATTIQELFDGSTAEFLQQGTIVFGDISDLLDQQFNRLSVLEQQVMYWLAINREWLSLAELQGDIIPAVAPRDLLETLDSLISRSLVEKKLAKFSQQPVVMEYITDRFIEEICQEILAGEITKFNSYALIKSQAKDYLRNTQTRLILKPIADRLLTFLGNQEIVQDHLNQLLSTLRSHAPRKPGYAGGNLLNLLWQLQVDLSGYNFSNLTVWQAYLQGMNLHFVNFSNSDLTKSVLTQTLGVIFSATFSPDGKLIAIGIDEEICLWQVADGRKLRCYNGHTSWVVCLAFSPDGQILASASHDQTVRLWNVQTGQCLKTLRGHTGWVKSVAFSPDGQILASGSNDQTVRLWNIHTGQYIKALLGHTGRIWSVAFSGNGQILVSSSEDQTVRVWDINNGQCLRSLETNINWKRSVALSPDGHILATGSDGNTVKLWDIQTLECVKVIPGYSSYVWSVNFSANGRLLATASEDKTVKIWDVSTVDCLQTLQEHTERVWLVGFSPDGQTLVSVSDDQTVKFWDFSSGQCLRSLSTYSNWVSSVAFSVDGQTLASSHADHRVRLWDISTAQCKRTLLGHTNIVTAVTFATLSDLSTQILASSSDDQTIKVWDAKTSECLRTLWGHSGWVQSVCFSPDGQILASGGNDYTVKLWDWRTGECLHTLQEHTHRVKLVAFSPEGTTLASGSDDQTIKLWDASTGICLTTLVGHEDWVLSVAFSPCGSLVASGSADQTIKLWHMGTGQCLRTFQGHTHGVRSITFSPDGQMLASSSDDQTVKLWDVNTGVTLKTLRGHEKVIWCVAFSPDGQMLASGSKDETIKLWSVATGECLKTFRAHRPYEGMNITGIIGLTVAEKVTLKALGAVSE
ncbi:MAG: CHAT domain-containing protein [Stigonema ocellatum SAG 48.90 = DSM 106950]|nr:CHAT domain-containing protein [Stigonema ocellatum SAG 48.90 = DSM 106950]